MSRREQHWEQREREAQSALDRIEDESETVGTSSFARAASRTRDHFAAEDKLAGDDRNEIWGSRIGRGAGLLFAIVLAVYLAATYF